MTARTQDPLDVCRCGDFRRQHQDGKGKCQCPSYVGTDRGRCGCWAFRLANTAEQYAERHPEHFAQMRALEA